MMRINCKELRKVERLDDKKHSSTNTKEGLLSEVDSVFYTWEGPRPSTIFKAKGRMTDILHARAYALVKIFSHLNQKICIQNILLLKESVHS